MRERGVFSFDMVPAGKAAAAALALDVPTPGEDNVERRPAVGVVRPDELALFDPEPGAELIPELN